MSDLISRQAAIDALIKWYGCEPNDIEAFEEIIEALPSAQPELKWVPVREELPREYGLYLVTTVKGNVYLWTYKPGIEEIWIHFILAWSYLPEPYEI